MKYMSNLYSILWENFKLQFLQIPPTDFALVCPTSLVLRPTNQGNYPPNTGIFYPKKIEEGGCLYVVHNNWYLTIQTT